MIISVLIWRRQQENRLKIEIYLKKGKKATGKKLHWEKLKSIKEEAFQFQERFFFKK